MNAANQTLLARASAKLGPQASLAIGLLAGFEVPVRRACVMVAMVLGTALDSGSFGLGLIPLPGVKPADAEAAMDKVIADFLASGPDMAAFERIRTQLRASEVYAQDDVDGIARRYGAALTTGLSVRDVQDWPKVLQEVTPEEVMAAARKVLDRRNAVTGWLLAEGGAQ